MELCINFGVEVEDLRTAVCDFCCVFRICTYVVFIWLWGPCVVDISVMFSNWFVLS